MSEQDNAVEDLRKARQYLDRWIAMRRNAQRILELAAYRRIGRRWWFFGTDELCASSRGWALNAEPIGRELARVIMRGLLEGA